jgi:hypothetical protein
MMGVGNSLPAAPLFPVTSRYSGVPTATLTARDGTLIVYLARRFVPSPSAFATVGWHTVSSGERVEIMAAAYLGDPLAFWRLCDANNALRPDELTEVVGRRLRITLPEGVSISSTNSA